jgi:hypothetical protein
MEAALLDPEQRNVGLREVLRNAIDIADGLLMSAIPGSQSALDAEIFAEIQASGTLRFKEKTGAFLTAPFRYDAQSGRLEVVDSLGSNSEIRHIRSGTGDMLAREFDPGSDYNRRVIKIAEQILSIGIVDEIVLGRQLPGAALLYLKPFPMPEDSADAFVRDVVRAISSYRPRAISDQRVFDTKYGTIIRRLMKSGISSSMMTPANIQSTIQTELTRAALRSEVWRKLWRWSGDCMAQAAQMRRINVVAGDPILIEAVGQIETALKRLASVIGVYVGNATTLYRKAIDGSDFYAEAPVCIAYVRETSPRADAIFTDISAWSGIWENLPANCSIADMRNRLNPHIGSIKRALTIPLPSHFVI